MEQKMLLYKSFRPIEISENGNGSNGGLKPGRYRIEVYILREDASFAYCLGIVQKGGALLKGEYEAEALLELSQDQLEPGEIAVFLEEQPLKDINGDPLLSGIYCPGEGLPNVIMKGVPFCGMPESKKRDERFLMVAVYPAKFL